MYSATDLIGDRPEVERHVASRPRMSSPGHISQMRRLVKEHSRADPLEPLHDRADVLVEAGAHKQLDVITRHFTRQNRQLVLRCDFLTNQVAHRTRHRTHQHSLPILRDPNQVNRDVRVRVHAVPVPPHATRPFASPEGDRHSRRGH